MAENSAKKIPEHDRAEALHILNNLQERGVSFERPGSNTIPAPEKTFDAGRAKFRDPAVEAGHKVEAVLSTRTVDRIGAHGQNREPSAEQKGNEPQQGKSPERAHEPHQRER